MVLPIAALLLFMIGLGVLLTRAAAHLWPLTIEDGVNRELAGGRTEGMTDVSYVVSGVANTPWIIAVTATVALILWLVLRSWREPLFLCLAVTAQALVFYFTTVAIDRPRPAVQRLDESPPTSSFPSGHTSAAVALYIGLAVLLAGMARHTWVKALCWALVLVPIGVALARMYRGMHHPSDVVAAFINGVTCVIVMSRALLDRSFPRRAERRINGARPRLATQ
ncbi:phosphatase PAP2 family protein [Actinoplanes aureus]|uniref:Phosphatase PAP2 family protein n=1 Tax=Actinoplanes aureus TaxID=2792083 RepID=A0A931C2G4_9ACTN|nr:phosphatase PAP2 family protein [Actinoplanes aureus]MBG0562130.1 phosphatase PAP2 family protein [Actinoplanes aureus]